MNVKVIKSNRKTMSLSVDDHLNAVVRAPYGISSAVIESFLRENSSWLEHAAERKRIQLEQTNISDDEMNELISLAENLIPKRVAMYSAIMNIYPARIRITKAKKRFGSCSGKNSLCFSCFLMKYPQDAIDYVVVHELAHIKHHNHSKAFYDLIYQYMPDYKEREKILKNTAQKK